MKMVRLIHSSFKKANDLESRNNLFVISFFLVLLAFLFYKQLGDALVIVSFVWLAIILIFNCRPLKNGLIYIFSFFVINILLSTVSLVRTGDLNFFKIIINSLTYFVIAFSFYSFGCSASDKRIISKVIYIIILIATFNSVINLFAWYFTTGGIISRYNFSSPINNSVSANVGLCYIASILSLGILKKNKIFGTVCFLLCSSNILIIITRKTQIFYVLSVLLFLLIFISKLRNKRTKIVLFSVLVVCSVILVLVFNKSIFSLFLSFGSDEDTYQRKLAMADSLTMLEDTLGFGVGYGAFSTFSIFTNLGSAHNGFFSFVSEFGILGTAIMISFIVVCVFACFKIFRKKISFYTSSAILVLIMSSSFFIANSVFFPPANERSYYLECAIYWILLGYLFDSCQNKNIERLDI